MFRDLVWFHVIMKNVWLHIGWWPEVFSGKNLESLLEDSWCVCGWQIEWLNQVVSCHSSVDIILIQVRSCYFVTHLIICFHLVLCQYQLNLMEEDLSIVQAVDLTGLKTSPYQLFQY